MDMKLENWKNIEKQPFLHDKATRQVFSGENVMMVLNTIQPDFPSFLHSHPHEQILHIIDGDCDVTVGNETARMGPGDMVHVPPNVQHDLKVIGNKPVLNLDIFTPIREDYLPKK
jgi:quercetin dioxygenase-like cupin family protein